MFNFYNYNIFKKENPRLKLVRQLNRQRESQLNNSDIFYKMKNKIALSITDVYLMIIKELEVKYDLWLWRKKW